MAYVCPVCEEPQVDGEHLANHMAFTAMLEGDDHEAWLDEHAPGWEDGDDAALAERLLETVERVDHPIDDTESSDHAGHDHDHGGRDPLVDQRARRGQGGGFGSIDDEAADVLEAARELTRQMQGDEEGGDEREESEDDADEPETD